MRWNALRRNCVVIKKSFTFQFGELMARLIDVLSNFIGLRHQAKAERLIDV